MEEMYLEIRAVHIGAVITSGSLFALRAGAANLLGAAWPAGLPARIVSWTVDTVLLTAALMLMTMVRQFPFDDAWLTVKVLMLIAYVVIGWWAFRAQRKTVRLACSVAAIAIFLFIVTVARTHNPLGVLSVI